VNRNSSFSYVCNACGLCCHDKVIALSPFDVMRIAREAGISTLEAIARFTIRRGSILKFREGGACVALDGLRCGVHRGRPLACRLYPLGIERDNARRDERFVMLDAAPGSLGVYSDLGTVNDFLEAQDIGPHLEANARYASLLPIYRERIAATVDFDRVLPREFWRGAIREALAESGYDPNPLIDATFDPDRRGISRESDADTIAAHIDVLAQMIRRESNPDLLASAAVMLAVSLGYSPAEVIIDC
jgi:Fe-S-cluster containining protein